LTFNTPETQSAVQLTGPDTLILNSQKPIVHPGPHQILCRVEAVGLCFSDLKLLKQFSHHARKSVAASGISPEVLAEVSSYVPGDAPTVPGHEVVMRIWEVGDAVQQHRPGERYLVQTDYRWLPTAAANSAFGYNFEGALQEFVLMDERVITSPDGESMLIPAAEDLSASAIALVEPWACVEDAYATKERQTLKSGGRMLIAADESIDSRALVDCFARYGHPADIAWVSPQPVPDALPVKPHAASLADLGDGAFDDILYCGSRAETIESLFPKLGPGGLLNLTLCGKRIDRPVATPVGRVHYGGIRIVGTTGSDPAQAMETIPATGELQADDTVNIVGAAGPMGVMHVVRDICLGVQNLTICAGDLEHERLAALDRIAAPLAAANGVAFSAYDPKAGPPRKLFSYTVVMVPVAALVAEAVGRSDEQATINIFAGIPADVSVEVDLNRYAAQRLYFIGTSGSTLADMRTVLARVEAGALDTNLSVAAICGMAGAIDGLRAVEHRSVSGKIVVYPSCRDLGLVTLHELSSRLPAVAALLDRGLWTRAAECQLLLECGA